MTLEKFGRTLILLVAIVLFVKGAGLAAKLAVPYIATVAPELADMLA